MVVMGEAGAKTLEIRDKTERKTCIGILMMIKMAKDQWALDVRRNIGSAVSWSDVIPEYLDQQPVCPSTNTNSYHLNLIGQNPTCTQSGHSL